MPAAKSKTTPNTFNLVPEVMLVNNVAVVVGMKAEGVLYFENFPPEAEGNKYEIPVKARSVDGTTLADVQGEDYEDLELLVNPAGEQLYVNKDLTLTTDPWLANGRDLKPTSMAIAKQASSKTSKRLKIINPEIVWPDGNMRTIKLDIKANAPTLPADYIASKQQAGVSRSQASVTRIDPSKLAARQFDEHLLKMLQESAVRGKQQFVCPENLQYLLDERTAVAARVATTATVENQPSAQ